jgi:uncharacterized protein YbjT (DUF2867 family)
MRHTYDVWMILVTGATGNIGSATVAALRALGAGVRAVSRSEREWPAGVEGFVGDLGEPSIAAAANGVEAAFLLAGYGGEAALLAALRAAGARRVVLLSSSSAPSGAVHNAVARYHILSEQAVAASGLRWTYLRPNSFYANALSWVPQLRAGDVVRGQFGDVPIAAVDPADVGAVAALTLTSDDHAGRAYRLSGPAALRPAEQVAILGAVLGRDLRWDGWTDEQARAELEAQMPREYVDAFFEFFVGGIVDETTVQPTVPELLGRPARSFGDWATANADAFR